MLISSFFKYSVLTRNIYILFFFQALAINQPAEIHPIYIMTNVSILKIYISVQLYAMSYNNVGDYWSPYRSFSFNIFISWIDMFWGKVSGVFFSRFWIQRCSSPKIIFFYLTPHLTDVRCDTRYFFKCGVLIRIHM